MHAESREDHEIGGEIERIRQIYCSDVLTHPNREVKLLGRKCEAWVLHTLLGFEVKLGRKRITCPDIVSARYLKIFGEIGMKSIRIPHDPSRTAILVAGLEYALGHIKELLLAQPLDERERKVAVRRTYSRLRERLELNE
ncbi:MAG: hypothetical protein ACE5JX_15055 [Acidobacteriota bacterium]